MADLTAQGIAIDATTLSYVVEANSNGTPPSSGLSPSDRLFAIAIPVGVGGFAVVALAGWALRHVLTRRPHRRVRDSGPEAKGEPSAAINCSATSHKLFALRETRAQPQTTAATTAPPPATDVALGSSQPVMV